MVVFITTFENKRQAKAFASYCIDHGLAACINLVPQIESHYKWKGKKFASKEILAIGKTTQKGFAKIKSKISQIHPYEVPELISFKASNVLDAYLKWVKESVN